MFINITSRFNSLGQSVPVPYRVCNGLYNKEYDSIQARWEIHSVTGFDIWLRMAEKRVLTDSESELSSSSEQTAGPSTRTQSAKKRKTMYKCKYSLQWTKTWPFIVTINTPFCAQYVRRDYHANTKVCMT